MPRAFKFLLAAAAALACALAWGFWHASTHVYLAVRVDDYGLRNDRLIYASPHNVSLSFFDEAGKLLANARSIEPAGYILAVHPDASIGDCSQHKQPDYARCHDQYSAWASDWSPKVRTASATIGSCVLQRLPVAIQGSNTEWLLWWIPLPHVGGVPHRYLELVVRVDTKTCTPAAVR
jgi:hypothetical protein